MKSKLLLVSLFVLVSSPLFASSRSRREHGAQLFSASGCRHCHTIHNVGGHKGPDLSGIGRMLTETQIRTQIIHGGNEMPPFTDVLEPDEITDLVAYLRSCRQKSKR